MITPSRWLRLLPGLFVSALVIVSASPAGALTARESANCVRKLQRDSDALIAQAQASGDIRDTRWEQGVRLGHYAARVSNSGSDPEGLCPRLGPDPSNSAQFQQLTQTLQRVQADASRQWAAAQAKSTAAARTAKESEAKIQQTKKVEQEVAEHRDAAVRRKDKCQSNWQGAISLQTEANQRGNDVARQVATEAAQKAKECVDKEIATVKDDDDLLKRALALRSDTEKKLTDAKREQALAEALRGKMATYLQDSAALLQQANQQPDRAGELQQQANQLKADLRSRLQQLER